MSGVVHIRRLIVPTVVSVMMIGGAMATYEAKEDAVTTADHVAELRHEVSQERMAISLLKAEWSELTQPGRLQDLIERYPGVFDLGSYEIDRMVRVSDLPFPPDDQPDLIAELVGGR